MYLQLAERPKYVNVQSYKRSPKVAAHRRKYPQLREDANPYIFVPEFESGTGGLFIREDKFDSMPEHQFKMFVRAIAPLQPEVQQGVLSEAEFLAGRAERREARQRRREAKTQKKESKGTARKERQERKRMRAESKAEARRTRAEAKQTRAEAKRDKAQGGGGGFDWEKAKDVGGSLISKFTGKGGEEAGAEIETAEKKWYQNPLVIGGGLLLIGGAIYVGTRPKQ